MFGCAPRQEAPSIAPELRWPGYEPILVASCRAAVDIEDFSSDFNNWRYNARRSACCIAELIRSSRSYTGRDLGIDTRSGSSSSQRR
jgi:hypothetical protein